MNNLDTKYNFKDGEKLDLPVYLNRQNPIPLDGTSVYKNLEEAQTYATSDPKAYPGQIISVVTESEVKVYKINNGQLEELGKGSLVTDQNPKELATTDNIGQIIYLTKDIKVTEESGEVTYSSGPYIVSGNGEVSKIGTTSASGDIAADVATLKGKVGTLKSTVDTLDGTVGKKGTGSDNPSTGLVKDVEDLVKKDTELAGKINNIKIEETTPESEFFAATYQFTNAAGDTVNINIPKDQFLKGVTYVADKPEPAEGNSADIAFPALRFEWQFTDKTITRAVTYISVNSLIDNYGIKGNELYLKKDGSNFYIDFDALKLAIVGSEDAPEPKSVFGKIKAAVDKATDAESVANAAKSAADTATSTAADASTAAVANTKTLKSHTTSICDLEDKVKTNTNNIATNTENITKNADAIAANTTAINKNTEAIGTQAVVTPATIAEKFTGLEPDTKNTYFLADSAGKPVAVDDIKKPGIYYIYKKTYNGDPHDEQNVTISMIRRAEEGEGKDFTYPETTNEATGLYQYIDNHIKNFDLSWQILD